MQFFVNPKHLVTLHPWKESPEHFIKVKKLLSAGEKQDISSAGIPHMMSRVRNTETADAETVKAEESEIKMGLDMGRMKLVRAAKYIVGWSLMNEETGVAVPVSEDTIRELTEEAFDAIDKALDEHKKAVDAEKKGQPGKPTLILESVSAGS